MQVSKSISQPFQDNILNPNKAVFSITRCLKSRYQTISNNVNQMADVVKLQNNKSLGHKLLCYLQTSVQNMSQPDLLLSPLIQVL